MPPAPLALPTGDDRTRLRRLRADDVDAFHAYRADAGLARFQGWSPMTPDDARAFVAEVADVQALQAGDWIQLAIADVADDTLVGDLGLFLEADGHEAEVGFTLARGAHGRGHATRAVALALRLVFDTSPAARVRAITDERNTASVRVLERAGFALQRRQRAVFKGEDCTELVFERQR
jgi:aminoglycoside 6'-N-acetyltransferase